jgi:hypothetical protein
MASTVIDHETVETAVELKPMELIERAQIDQQISTAKKYPRDLARVKRKMLDFATLDEETAASCFYTLPREGKMIQGPSVRLAEIAVACYGNLRAAAREVDNDGKFIRAQGVCHDLEANTCVSVEVKRRITNKSGKTYGDDMQMTTGNAANSIAFRNAVFKVVPGALIKPVYEAAKKVAVGDASTLTQRRAMMLSRFAQMGVTQEMILAKCDKSNVENIGLEDLELFIGLFTAIKEGDTTVDEAFAPPAKETAKVSLADLKPGTAENKGHDATGAEAFKAPTDETTAPPASTDTSTITQPQQKRLWAIAREHGWPQDELKAFLRERGYEHTNEIKRADYEGIVNELQGTAKPSGEETQANG